MKTKSKAVKGAGMDAAEQISREYGLGLSSRLHLAHAIRQLIRKRVSDARRRGGR